MQNVFKYQFGLSFFDEEKGKEKIEVDKNKRATENEILMPTHFAIDSGAAPYEVKSELKNLNWVVIILFLFAFWAITW